MTRVEVSFLHSQKGRLQLCDAPSADSYNAAAAAGGVVDFAEAEANAGNGRTSGDLVDVQGPTRCQRQPDYCRRKIQSQREPWSI